MDILEKIDNHLNEGMDEVIPDKIFKGRPLQVGDTRKARNGDVYKITKLSKGVVYGHIVNKKA